MSASSAAWTPPSTTTPHCFRCQFTPGAGDAALQRCAGCRSRHYCSRHCQKSDWSGGQKQECSRLATGGPVPSRVRTTMRMNMSQMMSDDSSYNSPDVTDQNTIYYLKICKPFINDIAISGPFYPLSAIVPNIINKLSFEGCKALGSLDMFIEAFVQPGPNAIQAFEHSNAQLPDGNIMHIFLMREENEAVARKLRHKDNDERVVTWNIIKGEPLLVSLDPPPPVVPMKELSVEGSFLDKDEARRCAKRVLAQYKAEVGSRATSQWDEGEQKLTGFVVGRSSDGVQYARVVIAQRDDGRIVEPLGWNPR